MPKKIKPSDIAEAVNREFILSGKVPVGERLPTVRALAKLYDTSNATIVHALIVLEEARRIDRKHGSGCYVLKTPVEKASSSSGIAFVAPSYRGDSIIPFILDGVEAAASAAGTSLSVRSSGVSPEEERIVLAELIQGGVEGVILYPHPRTASDEPDFLNEEFKDANMVLVDLATEQMDHSRVVFDNFQAGYDMTSKLLEAGRIRIGFWMQHVQSESSNGLYSIKERFDGCAACLKENGVELVDDWVWHDVWKTPNACQSESLLRDQLVKWTMANVDQRIDALLALDDVRAGIAINLARDLSIKVPDDIAVAGFDNISSVQRVFNHSFPTTRPDFARAGKLAFSMLRRRMSEEQTKAMAYLLPAPVLWPDRY